ncbi:hypothetical protein LJR045_003025 [Microbacterium sp. LjRoot45]|uniref:hypothetical protein n=1 Tax=Microbacterium sp. LjRoot45 TaxID=3342329 RepID=UPI003ED0DE88
MSSENAVSTARGKRRRSARAWGAALLTLVVTSGSFLVAATPAVAAVPAPTSTTSVITVKVGGDRVGQGVTDAGATIATPLAGVQLGLYSSLTAANPINTTWARCTSDADGDCSFIVPNTQVGGVNRDQRYYVREVSVPAGWYSNPRLRTGGATFPPSPATVYGFQTGVQLRANTTYRSSADFMFISQSTSTVTQVASGGVWTPSRNNPALPQECGLDVALILDLSSSMTLTPGEPFATASAITDAFAGTPTRMAVFTYGDLSPAQNGGNRPALLPVSTTAGATAFKNQWVGQWGVFGGTNWDAGLYQAAAASPHYDLAIHVTDGQPSLFGAPLPTPNTSSWNRIKETEYAILSANRLKSEGTRILGVGVGPSYIDNGYLNLRATSGPVGFNGSNAATADYIEATDFAPAIAAVRQIAQANCVGSISVVKQIVPSTNTGEDVTSSTLAPAGWQFDATTTAAGIGGLPATKTTINDGTGAVNFPLTFNGTTSGPVTVAETQQAGYEIVTQGGKNAVCVNTVTGAPVSVTNAGTVDDPGFTLTASAPAAISCTVYNREIPELPADLTVEKVWEVDGQTFDEGDQPAGLDAQLQLTGPDAAGATDQDWGATRTGYVRDDVATVTEEATVSGDYEHCTVEGEVTDINGAPQSTALDADGVDVTLTEEHNTVEITNTVTCEQTLSLVKEVGYGDEPTSSWTLSASGPGSALPGPSGTYTATTPVSAPVSGGATYGLEESGGPLTYVGAGWECALDEDGTAVTVTDGFMTMPRGQDVTCTIVNSTASLTILKHVIDPQPGFEADAWELTATPDTLSDGPLPTATLVGAETDVAGANTVEVRPGHGYTLSEESTSETLAYRQVALQRLEGSTWVDVDSADIVAPGPGDTAVYRFVNERIPSVALPLTGGASADAFLIGGSATIALAVFAGLWLMVRRRRVA